MGGCAVINCGSRSDRNEKIIEMQRNLAKKEQDPELEMRRKFLLKCAFRAVVRLVQANVYWMLDTDKDMKYDGVEDVKKRVAQAIRGKKKRLLSIEDKALLNKATEDRTDKEKKYLYRILGGLKCFKRYPPNVKRKLAAATYFVYYGPGRVIVRERHDAEAMYFIVTGEVGLTQKVWDGLIQEYVSAEIGKMETGDMFGEVALLHNIQRSATVTTTSHCEFLVLKKQDFKNILQTSVQKQWDEVRQAMDKFTYFEALDDVARREGCIVAKMKTYETNETILGDGIGVPNFVYFVLKGRCQMIETLQVFCTTRQGKTFYRLYEPPQDDIQESDSIDFEKYFRALKKESSYPMPSKYGSYKAADTSQTNADKTTWLKEPSVKWEKSATIFSNASAVTAREPNAVKSAVSVQDIMRNSGIKSDLSLIKEESTIFPSTPKNLRTYFMEVCQTNPGSSFGFGENMKRRRIVALTPVSCLLLPKIWLMQRNTANIWTRIEYYLNKKIPTTRQLFDVMVQNRGWEQYREQLVDEIVERRNTVNFTTVHDVPYSIRIEEQLDI